MHDRSSVKVAMKQLTSKGFRFFETNSVSNYTCHCVI